jgi:cell wall-associated NlpC family hydrolase
MKNQFILLYLLINLSGCEVFRPASRNTDNLSAGTVNQPVSRGSQPVFIQSITTETAGTSTKNPETPVYRTADSRPKPHPVGTDDYNQLKFKYAILTNTPVEDMSNMRLLIFMDQWYGVPYQYGGASRDGIDCSAFSSLLLSTVYNINQLPRMSADQYLATRRLKKKDLKEGDLVFFHTSGKGHKITHVGVYFYNNRFVHASIAGVQISDLGEGYYMTHYVGAGRVTEY